MKNAHPFPLPAAALDEFRHPAEWHGLHRAVQHGGEVLAGNGYVAIRCRRGAWLDSDFPAASAEFLSRFGKLPWKRFETLRDDWRLMDTQRGRIFAHGRHGQWLNGRMAPSPVWALNEQLVRLSLIQLVATLPRCEVYVAHCDRQDPVFFRFSGGIGLIAADRRLTLASGSLFAPRRDCITDKRMTPSKPTAYGSTKFANWPPAEPQD
jgi:hypothetical protein